MSYLYSDEIHPFVLDLLFIFPGISWIFYHSEQSFPFTTSNIPSQMIILQPEGIILLFS